jgi:two-component system chemotaxis sensor kinase CheA
MEQFIKKFIEEATELISKLEIDILELEKNPNSKEHIEEVFRVMHTFKGVSSMFGFENISEFTHHMESVYDHVREGVLAINQDIIELTFESVDLLKQMINQEKGTEKKAKQITKKIIQILDFKNSPEIEKNLNQKPTFYIVISPDENINKINFLNLFGELSRYGDYSIVYHSFPNFNLVANDISEWGIYITSNHTREEITQVFSNSGIKCNILKISKYNLFEKEEFLEKLKLLSLQHGNGKTIQKTILEEITNSQEDLDLSDTLILFENDKDIVEWNKEFIKEKKLEAKKEIELSEFSNSQKNTEKIKNLSKQVTSRVSVDSEKLDKLMYLVSELIINKAEFEIIKVNKDFSKLEISIEKLDKLTRQFRDVTLSVRLVPINDMLIRFQRLIRDLSKDLGKEINFVTYGVDTELDKNVIDNLAEPIMHILRNALDHGIENPDIRKSKGKSPIGKIEFTSFYSGQSVIIKIKDDGNGIDPENLLEKAISKGFISSEAKLSKNEIFNLIFLPGFSTAQNLTEVSGRGVGMDVVKRKISDLRGEVDVNSIINEGTEISIKLPISLSILDALLVRIDTLFCLVPLDVVDSCTEELHEILETLPNSRLPLDDVLIPFIKLRNEFGINGNVPRKERIVLIVNQGKRVGLVVDEVLGEHQAVIKPLGQMFKEIDFVSGGSILGSGDVAMVLDTNKLISLVFSL